MVIMCVMRWMEDEITKTEWNEGLIMIGPDHLVGSGLEQRLERLGSGCFVAKEDISYALLDRFQPLARCRLYIHSTRAGRMTNFSQPVSGCEKPAKFQRGGTCWNLREE